MHLVHLASAKSLLIVFLPAVITSASLAQAPPVTQALNQARTATSLEVFRITLAKSSTSLNFDNAASTEDLALIPVSGRWDLQLQKANNAVVGAIHAMKPNKFVDQGTYLIRASQADGIVQWQPLKPDGTTVGRPARVIIERVVPEITQPRAEIVVAPQRRCCYFVDGIRHCVECD